MFDAGGVGGGMGDILLRNNGYPYTRKGGPRGFRQKKLQTMDSIELVQGSCLNQQDKIMTVCARWYGCCHGDGEQGSISYIFFFKDFSTQ
jgi:hypothetical protein